MIVGLGLDVAELSRIERAWQRHGVRFINRILTQAEAAAMPPNPVPWLAARFAAKEAASKALGTGFSNGVTFQNMEVRSLPSGQPTLVLHGEALNKAQSMGVGRLHLSLTHGREVAAAVVILESETK
jgi:holo-[acyl-carrier protein] synthase